MQIINNSKTHKHNLILVIVFKVLARIFLKNLTRFRQIKKEKMRARRKFVGMIRFWKVSQSWIWNLQLINIFKLLINQEK